MRLACAVLALLAGAAAVSNGPAAAAARGAAAVWNHAGDGNWTDAANWTGGVPNAVDAEATFAASANVTFVTVDQRVTVGRLTFDNGDWLYAIDGAAAPLVLEASAGPAHVSAVTGQHFIFAPLELKSDATFDVGGFARLDVAAGIDSPTRSLTKTGAGPLAVPYVRASALTINGGAVGIAADGTRAGLSVVGALNIAAGQALDLADNSLVIDYTGGSPLASVRALLASGYARGRWDSTGIRSSAAQGGSRATALGYAEASALGINQFMGEPVDGTAVLIKYTWYGDANLDGKVDAADLALMSLTGTDWSRGDFNFDGAVTPEDYALFTLGASLQTSVLGVPPTPEPGTAGVAVLTTMAWRARRRSRA
jgi:hypothetical protein